MKKESAYRHIFKYIGLFGSVQGLNILIGLIRNKLIAVLLGPQGVGLISIFNSASTFIQNATNFGMQISGVREISQAYNAENEELTLHYIRLLRSWCILAGLLGMCVCLILSNALSNWSFSSNEHTVDFMLLSVVVGMAALAGGETAILKATRRLKELANISVLGVISALVVSVPLYVKFSYDGIIPSLMLIGLVQMALAMLCSYRHYPLQLSWQWTYLKEGSNMIRIGVAFVVAGIMGSGADFAIRSFLSDISVSLTGLYNAGYMIAMTYAGMAFAALDSDYYPHLSGVCHDTEKMNGAANRQIEVSLIIVAPMLVALTFGLKILIPLLFSAKFLPVVAMAQVAILAMYFRTMNLPVSYITLAKGDSVAYMCLEAVYDVIIVATIVIGYNNWGLTGTGVALVVTNMIDVLCVTCYCIWKYDFELSVRILRRFLLQLLIGFISLMVAVCCENEWIYWIMGLILLSLSGSISWYMIKHKYYE